MWNFAYLHAGLLGDINGGRPFPIYCCSCPAHGSSDHDFPTLSGSFLERLIERSIQVLVVPRSSRVLIPPPSFLGNNSDEQEK
jgi:hypothetical protein